MSVPGRRHLVGDSVRQQLDELDALLQQMLGLPVYPKPPEARVPEPQRPASPSPASGAAPTATVPPPATDGEPSVPVALRSWPPPVRPDSGRVRFRSRGRITLRGPWKHGLGVGVLVAVNRTFDGLTYALGPVGRWLRGDSGRAALGWTGMGLCGVAAGWVILDWLAWLW
jgi:hypothetical protein